MNQHNYLGILIGFISVLLPFVVYAADTASLSLRQPSDVLVGEIMSIPLDVAVSGEVGINSLGATITIDGPATIKSVHTGNSIFSLWPELEIQNTRTLVFLGGSPASVGGSSLRVLTLELAIEGPGTIGVTASNAQAFFGDGVGTPISISGFRNSFIALVGSEPSERDASQEVRSQDTTPPESFAITIGRDSSVFNGKYFISFNTLDRETGVERYEVEEAPFASVVSNGTYVLKDQSMSSPIIVRAYDAAGNVREETLNNGRAWVWEPWLYAMAASLVLILALLGVRAWILRRRPMVSS